MRTTSELSILLIFFLPFALGGGRQGSEEHESEKGRGLMSSLGCFACRHPCCFFTNCTKFECPTCHLKVKMCENNCPCNIFTSDEMVAAPWAKPVQYQLNDEELKIEIGGQTEEELENEEQWCGAPECNQRCKKGEWCANTGETCTQYPCCESTQCITFEM